MIRRVAALLMMLLLAHLDLARAYVACAREDTHRAVDHQQMSMHDHASTPAPAHESPPPSNQGECCRAMAACMTSLALTGETAPDAPWRSRVALPAGVVG